MGEPSTVTGDAVAPRPSSQTLDRGLLLLDVVSRSTEPVSLAELSQAMSLHQSIVYRLLRTLEDHHMVVHTPYGYILGTGAHSLGRRTSPVLQKVAKPEVARLATAVGLSAFFVIRDQEEAVTLVSVEVPSTRLGVVYSPGDRHPLTLGSPGLAILACDPPRPGERPELAAARRHGWISTRGEVIPELGTLAAPVTTHSGRAVASIAIVYRVETPGPSQINTVLEAARVVTGKVRQAERAGTRFPGIE